MGLVTHDPLPFSQKLESQPPKNQQDTHVMLHVMILPYAFLRADYQLCKSRSWVIADGYDVLIEGKKV